MAYLNSLAGEMALWAERSLCKERDSCCESASGEFDTVFIGGGTPSLLSVQDLEFLFRSIRENFSLAEEAEISMECNPGTLTSEKIRCCRQGGINRISLGLQSALDTELARLGRIHRWEDFYRSFCLVREAGFENINVDIMSAIPGQTISSWEETLDRVLALRPRHISAYSLILEEGTPFHEKYGDTPPVDEESDRLMYERTGEMLAAAGYRRYEISNYALPGGECRHNLKYWRRHPYLGVGLGAASFLAGRRFSNERDMVRYQEKISAGILPVAESEEITEEMARQEFMFLGLRCMEGVSCRAFQKEFGLPLASCFGEAVDTCVRQGLLAREDDRIFLTSRGIDVSNRVFAMFL